jgi:hypothetical protein
MMDELVSKRVLLACLHSILGDLGRQRWMPCGRDVSLQPLCPIRSHGL